MVPTFCSGHFSIQVWASIAYNLKTLLVVLPLAPRKKQLGSANQWDPTKNLTAVRYCNWIINGLLWDAITALGTININVMMTPRSGVSVDDDEVDGVSDEIGDVGDNEVDGVGDKVGGVNTSVQCVDLMLEVIPGPQWTTAFGSIYIRTANLLWAPSDVR
ncbi:hypothetical protein NDA12_001753 [Ustilago hordei]|nr:hypothetical protein NDA12_001753 [Ustilago hordei]